MNTPNPLLPSVGTGRVPGDVDAVVLGGGPAGTAFALALLGLGRTVVIVERSRYESSRVGETLPPEIQLPLTRLGVWERFLADGHTPSPGIVCAWGHPEPRHNDYVLNPYGPGWHVDRRRFDLMLAQAARSNGGELLMGAELTQFERIAPARRRLQITSGGVVHTVRASMLVDAAGRTGSPIRSFGERRLIVDRLIALVGVLANEQNHAGTNDLCTLVEAVEDGWWYSAPLPGARFIAAFMTDADLLPRRGRVPPARFWSARLEDAPLTRQTLADEAVLSSFAILPANSSRLQVAAADGWIAIGDAAAAMDPLSSQGIYRALTTAIDAAQAVHAHLSGDRNALQAYASGLEVDFATDLQERTMYYRLEGRWSQSPFWARRNGLPDARPGHDSLHRFF